MKGKELENHIVNWLSEYIDNNPIDGFVVGVSGGIDSSVVSILCAKTNKPVLVISMPINNNGGESLSDKHINFLKNNFSNVKSLEVDLTFVYETLKGTLNLEGSNKNLSLANTQSRLRMATLYAHSNNNNYIVCGTGNKVEDFGLFFYTKGGDGMVDVSPIADLMKSEVYELGRHLGIIDEIINVAPTDGLWDGSPTDEEQLGGSYDEFEWVMEELKNYDLSSISLENLKNELDYESYTDRQREIIDLYYFRHVSGIHKSLPIPICEIPK